MYNVLIVDDSNVERRGIRRLLEKHSCCFRIIEACDGEDAYEKLCASDIDIVFTDVRMPIVDGITLLKMIKDYDSSIQTVIFSAYNDFEYTSKAIENKADGYILKPIDVDGFYKVLENIVNAVEEKKRYENQEKEIIRNLVDFNDEKEQPGGDKTYGDVFRAISEENLEEIVLFVQEMFDGFKSSKSMSVLYIKQICVEISKRLCRLLVNEKAELKDVLNEIVQKRNPEEIEEYMTDVVVRLTEKIKQEREAENDKWSAAIKSAVEIVRTKYSEDISLDSVATEVALSPKYFGQLFKKEMGEGFVKYLTHYRLEKAEQLLRKTNANINDICRQIGIQDSSYFCFIFKKRYGESPLSYRKRGGDK